NVNFQSTSNTAKYSLFLHDALPISTTATAPPPRPTTPKPHHAALVAERKETTMTTPTPQELCPHWEHEHVYTSEEGPRCANCGKQLTILETLNPNERWTITNDGKGNLTIEHQ